MVFFQGLATASVTMLQYGYMGGLTHTGHFSGAGHPEFDHTPEWVYGRVNTHGTFFFPFLGEGRGVTKVGR